MTSLVLLGRHSFVEGVHHRMMAVHIALEEVPDQGTGLVEDIVRAAVPVRWRPVS